jgi:hypothetical protein
MLPYIFIAGWPDEHGVTLMYPLLGILWTKLIHTTQWSARRTDVYVSFLSLPAEFPLWNLFLAFLPVPTHYVCGTSTNSMVP